MQENPFFVTVERNTLLTPSAPLVLNQGMEVMMIRKKQGSYTPVLLLCFMSAIHISSDLSLDIESYATLLKMRRNFCPFPKKIGFLFSKWEFFYPNLLKKFCYLANLGKNSHFENKNPIFLGNGQNFLRIFPSALAPPITHKTLTS